MIGVSGADEPMYYDIDISIAADSCLVYSRIIAICIALTLPALLGDPPSDLKRPSFRDVSKYASQRPETPLGKLFSGASLEWFETLSRKSVSRWGIRENLIHYGAFNVVG